jgi:glycosyltransferase involved in cell wall biosynthesis
MQNKGKKRSKVAILLRTKGRPVFLSRALKSILKQSYSDWAIHLIADGASDRSALDPVLHEFQPALEGKIEFLFCQRSNEQGIGHLLNLAIENSDSEYIAIHDDDDSWEPEFLARCLEKIREDAAIVVQSMLVKEQFHEGALQELERTPFNPWQKHAISLFRLAEGQTFPSIALFFRRDILNSIGIFDPTLSHKEDWEFCLRLFAKYEVGYLEESLANFHYRYPAMAPPNGNLIIDQGEHFAIETEIRNKLLRNDLKSGKIGLGYLSSLAAAHGSLFSEIQRSKRNNNS